MITIILYVWVFDLFLYSNTELFPVFSIFFNFGIFVFNLIVWGRDLIDGLISTENRGLYVVVLSLRERFRILRQSLLSESTIYCVSDGDASMMYQDSFSFIEFGRISGIAIRKYELYVYQLIFTRYLQNLLFQMRTREFINFYSIIFRNFIPVELGLGCGSDYTFVVYPGFLVNPVLVVLTIDFQFVRNFDDTFHVYWFTNILFADFMEII